LGCHVEPFDFAQDRLRAATKCNTRGQSFNISDPLVSAEQNDLRMKALREIETAASKLKYKEPSYSEHLEQMTGR
jgi:hypothetical protein